MIFTENLNNTVYEEKYMCIDYDTVFLGSPIASNSVTCEKR